MTSLDTLARVLARRAPVEISDPARSEAAVALILTREPDRLLLIRRVERAGDPWSGQLALPGGRRASGDRDLLATAIRETAEEIGIALTRDGCAAQLDDLAPSTPALPPILVRPFVFLLDRAVPPAPGVEVSHAVWLSLGHLVTDGVFGARTVEVRGSPRTVNGYQIPEGFLWGLTERIVTPVLRLWAAPPAD